MKKNKILFLFFLQLAGILSSQELSLKKNITDSLIHTEVRFTTNQNLSVDLKKGYHSKITFTQQLIKKGRNPLLFFLAASEIKTELTKEAWWDPFDQIYVLETSNGLTTYYKHDDVENLINDFFTHKYRFFLPVEQEKASLSQYIIKAKARWRKVELRPPMNILYIWPYFQTERTGWNTFNLVGKNNDNK